MISTCLFDTLWTTAIYRSGALKGRADSQQKEQRLAKDSFIIGGKYGKKSNVSIIVRNDDIRNALFR